MTYAWINGIIIIYGDYNINCEYKLKLLNIDINTDSESEYKIPMGKK